MMSDPVMTIVSAYAVFAFLLTLVREIIKDCEDVAGDMAFGASTLPAVLGIRAARIIAALLSISVAVAIAWIQVTQSQWENKIAFGYMVVLLQIPMLWLAFRCIRARTITDDRRNALIAKWIMVAGILSMPVLYLSSV
jgi:4-hydroxybenzoate polyprenyltransferase